MQRVFDIIGVNISPIQNDANDAQTRGRAYYEYLQTGQLKGIYHWWDTLQSNGSYTSQFIRGNECDYEVTTGLRRGLKTASRYLVPVSGQPLNWQTQRQVTYSYDANLDYLVGANYGDGLPNANVTWTYDAAGNRASDSSNSGTWTYDNLNRMTASPGYTYTNDILGNRLTKTQGRDDVYTWDILNRLKSHKQGINPQRDYTYRADGLRVSKSFSTGASGLFSTVYRYDGQMGTEDLTTNNLGVVTELHRTTLGARGVDMMVTTTSSGTSITYPLYDAHGNMVAQVAKSGSGFNIGNEKSYDAWGGVRSGDTSSDPKSRYCANLGHKQDDESGLVYMRSRYYEPGSGRFVSEDRARDGGNWFTYCENQPQPKSDSAGKSPVLDFLMGLVLFIVGFVMFAGADALITTSLTTKIWEGQFASMLRSTGLSAETAEQWNSDLKRLIGSNISGNNKTLKTGVQAGGVALMAGGFAKAFTALTGYSFMLRAMIWDAMNPEDGDILCTIFGS